MVSRRGVDCFDAEAVAAEQGAPVVAAWRRFCRARPRGRLKLAVKAWTAGAQASSVRPAPYRISTKFQTRTARAAAQRHAAPIARPRE